MMLTGNNGIIIRAVDSKERTDLSQIEEAIKLEYFSLLGTDILNYGNSATVKQAIENIMTKDEYKDKIEKKNGGSGSITLSANSVIVGATSPNNIATITIEEGSSDGEYYAVSSGKYYKILTDSDDLKIDRTPTEFSEDDTSSGGGATKVIVADTTKATASLSDDKKTITITGVAAGNTSITVEGINKTATIEVVSSITDVNLDGAIIPGTLGTNVGENGSIDLNYTSDKITQGDESIAKVTSEGVIKCGTKTGTTAVKINGKAYRVTSTAKTVPSTSIGSGAPSVPAGFTAIDTNDAKWSTATAETDKGLVIMDSKGNQFVWVPVPASNLNSMFMCKKHSATSDCDIHLTSDNTGLECRSETHKEINGDYCTEIVGKLYATSTGENFGTVQETYTEDNGLREPDILNSTSYGDWSTTADRGLNLITRYVTEYIGKNITTEADTIKLGWTNQLKKEFNKMAVSVAKNGGFYIGRYESSLINGTTRVVAGATSMSAGISSAGTWYGLYQKQKDFISAGSLKSTMIWGSQYDRVMNWIGDDTKIKDTSGTNGNQDTNRITGVVPADKLKNIFDLYGLRYEWTLEAYSTYTRVTRGGFYSHIDSPSYRNLDRPYNTSDRYGSRPSLYIE